MKRRILITSIIVFLSVLALINVEPNGITAEEKAVTAMQVDLTSPVPNPAYSPADADNPAAYQVADKQAPDQTAAIPPVEVKPGLSQTAAIPPIEAKTISSPTAATPPVVPTKTEPKQSNEDKIQTEAATSSPSSKPAKTAQGSTQVQPSAPVVTSASAQQQEMLGYINTARAQANLSPLTLDSRLCKGAYLKSQDMAVNGYFSHISPTYGSPFDMMKNLGITYRTAAENIARNSSVLAAHNAFMNSSGHRANILNPAFTKIGLGFYQNGSDLFVTQWFTN